MAEIFKSKAYIILLVFFLLSSCKSYYKFTGEKQNIRPAKLYQNIIENQPEYTNLSIRFSAKISSEENSDSFKGNLRILKDSVIWISARSLNIEGARILITKDSLQFVNRIDNTYFSGKIDSLSEHFDIDFSFELLQAIISHQFFLYPPPEDTIKTIQNFKQCSDTDYYCMSSLAERKYIKYYIDSDRKNRWERKLEKEMKDSLNEKIHKSYYNEFIFQIIKAYPEIYRISEISIENYIRQQTLNIKYLNLSKTDEVFFPKIIMFEYNNPQINISFQLTIENISIDREKLNFPFSIPAKYEPVKLIFRE